MLCHKRLLNNSKTCVNLTQIEDWRFWRSPVYYTSVCKHPQWKRFVKIILSTWCIPTKSIFSCNIQSNPCLRKKEKLILDKSQTFLKAIPRRVDMHTRQMCIKWIFCPHSTFSETVLHVSTKEGGGDLSLRKFLTALSDICCPLPLNRQERDTVEKSRIRFRSSLFFLIFFLVLTKHSGEKSNPFQIIIVLLSQLQMQLPPLQLVNGTFIFLMDLNYYSDKKHSDRKFLACKI